ncbi:hypothetical protein [Kribbella sp. NPDC023855]|uniref:hypothetical protein n=1 Tax=Kribbella sp. NPDC023855 TaxID=3154698 RepID=UPI0033C354D4
MTAVDERPHYRTAEQELSDSLEGTAPALSRTVAGLIGPARTAELAKAILRATDLAVRRHAMDKLADALAVVEEAIGGIPPECESAEPWSPDPDEAAQQARVDRFMAGGNGA